MLQAVDLGGANASTEYPLPTPETPYNPQPVTPDLNPAL